MDPQFVAIYDNWPREIAAFTAKDPASRIRAYMLANGVPNPAFSTYASQGGPAKVISSETSPDNGFSIVQYHDGTIYVGHVTNGLRHGYGVRTFPNSPLVYAGEYLGGRRNGRGKLIDAPTNHVVYDGQWKTDKKDGQGVLIYDKGTYHGEFKEDLFHGKGKMSWANGEVYYGDFYNGHRTGKGVIKFLNGDVYEGDFLNGFAHGNGTYRWTNGDVYVGAFQNGNLAGHGTIKYDFDVKGTGVFGTPAINYELIKPSRFPNSFAQSMLQTQ